MIRIFITFFIFIGTGANLWAQANENLHQQWFMKDNRSSVYAMAEGNSETDITKPESRFAAKSKGKAFILSLILPGLGEKYVGASKKAQYFFASEITLWLTYSGFVTYREWVKDDYKTFAASHAAVDLQGKSDSYFVDIGNYTSIYEYNAAKLRQRNLPAYYYDVQANYWNWESAIHRHDFKQMRISADRADTRATFVIGAILANHVLSAIDAVWSVHKYEKTRKQAMLDWDVYLGNTTAEPSVLVNLTAHF